MNIVGKFREIYKDDSLPSIKDSIQNKSISEKERILHYLKSAKKGAFSPGNIKDVITGEKISGEFCCYSDGEYAWRSDIIYYVEKYNLKLDSDFIKHILQS